ncbi:MAG: hypothetical protein M3169_12055 [Candidatus Eremiobacteraeota bacterium]|nr:hypothetical protein [Candidatus Eremiobacteraeota bacterium]
MNPGACEHAATVKDPPPRTPEGCEECLRDGDIKHFQATKHPVIASFQPGEHWKWCYVDEVMWE